MGGYLPYRPVTQVTSTVHESQSKELPSKTRNLQFLHNSFYICTRRMGASQSSRGAKKRPVTGSTDPLFVEERSSSADSNERAAQEDDALLGGRTTRTNRSASFWKDLILLVWSVFATAAVIILAILYQRAARHDESPQKHTGKRNLIFMVSDGMGPASLSMTRSFRQFTESKYPDNVHEQCYLCYYRSTNR